MSGVGHDPWFEQDKLFIEAVRSGDGSAVLNSYTDGLKSLAPVLAGWHSSRHGGALVACDDVSAFAALQEEAAMAALAETA